MSQNGLRVRFLQNQADEDQGLNDAGIETYRSTPFASIARECGQNSRDAAASKPVVVTFDSLPLTLDDLPDSEQFRAHLQACLHRANKTGDDEELAFFTNAIERLESGTLPTLVVSDTGTKGLSGPCTSGTPFHTLVKTAGVSRKGDVTSGGSFGIGKMAAYAVSELRTVFYSTIYHDEERNENFLAQGKCKLVSHPGPDGMPMQATGYWCTNNFMPADSRQAVPEWLRRSEVGTTVAAVGFTSQEDWKYRIAESILRNFFTAIYRGSIEFRVDDGRIPISADTVDELFVDERIIAAASENDTEDELTFSHQLYECLTSNDARTETTTIDGLGAFRLRLLIRDDLPKRVCIIRNGMRITDSLKNFGDQLSRFPLYQNFVAILEPADDNSSEHLKQMETPRHDELTAERLLSPEKQKFAKSAMSELRDWLRESIRTHTVAQAQDEVTIDELSEYFSNPDTIDEIPDPGDQEDNPQSLTYRPAERRRQFRAGQGSGDAGGGGGQRGRGSGGEGSSGTGEGSGQGGKGNRGPRHQIPVTGFRNVPVRGDARNRRRLYFTPKQSGPALLRVDAAGMSDALSLPIRAVDGRKVDGNAITVELKADQRCEIVVDFEHEFEGPIELQLIPSVQDREVS